ncbi:MAG TPA: hemerythrin family protein [Fibrobacteria bacterium]|nr:hemerythrin family protein [Fibrobacteria bacterium]HOX52559.1 hemerythrin family protein [Fibrobacteria bacterium]
MNAAHRINGISFHVPDLDDSFPKLFSHFEEFQQMILNHDENPLLEAKLRHGVLLAIRTFRREEEAMELCHDPGQAMHKMAHQKFLRTLQEIGTTLSKEGPSVPLALDVRNRLVEWIVDHHRLMNASLGRLVKTTVERSLRHHQESDTGTAFTG